MTASPPAATSSVHAAPVVLAEVKITSLTHPTNGATGQYFFFSKDQWQAAFGAAPSGTHFIHQWRSDAQIWCGNVVVWDNDNGVHGRREPGSASAKGQWQINDMIRPVRGEVKITSLTDPAAVQDENSAESAMIRFTAAAQSAPADTFELNDAQRKVWGKKGERLEKMLATSVLVDARYLIALAKEGRRVPRCQDLPDAAKITPSNVQILRLWAKAGSNWWTQAMLPVLVLSYGWLSKEHPDPVGEQLKAMSGVLEAMLATARKMGGEHCTIGVWQDYTALPQYPRSDAENFEFKSGLEMINEWYMHPGLPVLAMTRAPTKSGLWSERPEHSNLKPYGNRAWCFFEMNASSIMKHQAMLWDFKRLGSTGKECCPKGQVICARCFNVHKLKTRKPPRAPPVLEKEIREGTASGALAFTNSGDADVVIRAYARGFAACFESGATITYANLNWGDAEAVVLAETLQFVAAHCKPANPVTICLAYKASDGEATTLRKASGVGNSFSYEKHKLITQSLAGCTNYKLEGHGVTPPTAPANQKSGFCMIS